LDKEFRLVLSPDRNGAADRQIDDTHKLVDQFEELVAAGVPSLSPPSLTVDEGFS
jgi:hypothetical protein